MAGEWQLQQAKNGFSKLIKDAVGGEAQWVTVHGKPTAVVVSAEEYTRLTRRSKGRLSTALLRPDIGVDAFDLARDRDTGRDIDL